VKQLRAQLEDITAGSDYDRGKLQERLAKLVGGVAIINVGAATETEMKEKKARVEDALHATRAAVEEGIVPGGGVAYLRALQGLESLQVDAGERFGVDIVRRALEEPMRQIAQNGGWEGSIVVNKVREGLGAFGFNAATGRYEDLIEAGVIDPTKVARFALQNAVSVASLMLTTEAMVVEKAEAGAPPRKWGCNHGERSLHGKDRSAAARREGDARRPAGQGGKGRRRCACGRAEEDQAHRRLPEDQGTRGPIRRRSAEIGLAWKKRAPLSDRRCRNKPG